VADGSNKVTYVGLMKIFSNSLANLTSGMCRVVINGEGKVPTRMKFGLNFIKAKNSINLPSNICFNANLPNSKVIDKPGTFRWCTLFDYEHQRIYLHNTSFIKQGCDASQVKAEVCRTLDDQILELNFKIPRDGSVEVLGENKEQIREFLNEDIGWISFQCSSPFVSGYYVMDKGNGVVGADHLY